MASTRSPLSADPDDDTGRAPLTSWYTQGVADGFGDRLLMFDNAATGPIELLRVRRDLAAVPGFESALRARFAQLTAFTHSGFAQARVVNHLDNGGGLTVASTHVTGTRLSALFEASRPSPGMHPGAVREVFGDLVSAIGDLHKVGGGIAHGALSADRIILTFDRRLIVSDYVFGAALERLHLPASRLWTDFGLASDPSTGVVHHDQRGDLTQLGLLMMCLVLGRRITPDEYATQMPSLLADFTTASDRRAPDLTSTLRDWLEQSIDRSGFDSLDTATHALAQWPTRPHYIDLHKITTKALPSALEPTRAADQQPSMAAPAERSPARSVDDSPQPSITRVTPSAPAAAVATNSPHAGASNAPAISVGAVADTGLAKGAPLAAPTPVVVPAAAVTGKRPPASDKDASGEASDINRLWPKIIEAAIVVGERVEGVASTRAPIAPAAMVTSDSDDSRFASPVKRPERPAAGPEPSVIYAVDPPISPDFLDIDSRMYAADSAAPAATPVQSPPARTGKPSPPSEVEPNRSTVNDGLERSAPQPVSPLIHPPSMSASPAMSDRSPFAWAIAGDTERIDEDIDADGHQTASGVQRWVIAALITLAVGQGLGILRLLSRPSAISSARVHVDSPAGGDEVFVDGKKVGETPVDVQLFAAAATVRIVPRQASTATTPPQSSAQVRPVPAIPAVRETSRPPAAPRPASQASEPSGTPNGGVQVISPISLQVLDGNEPLGSTDDGVLFTVPGARSLTFVNDSLGFRATQRVQVVAGTTATVRVTPPNGLLSVTAQPWAQVWIDGRRVGDTPITNLPIAVGDHEILFRNPKLGERRQKTTIQTRVTTRVSASFNP
ncbi:MAG: PEGA domain-containing protein [Vicinamibacterales bacterium]